MYGITMQDFHVPWIAASDHLPLVLTFDLR
jgi:hypothetical protein